MGRAHAEHCARTPDGRASAWTVTALDCEQPDRPARIESRSGNEIVLAAFRAAPGGRLTNVELGALHGLQAFRSRISDLRKQGHVITEGRRVSRGVYEYVLVEGDQLDLGA